MTPIGNGDLMIQDGTTDLQLSLFPEEVNPMPLQSIPPSQPRPRKSRERPTPLVDDEVQRSTRQHHVPGFVHMELDDRSKPRKLVKEDTTRLMLQLETALEEATQHG